jgi:hypothetical protein
VFLLKKILKKSEDLDTQKILEETQFHHKKSKIDIVNWIAQCLFSQSVLKLIYSSLSWIEQVVVQEAVHDPLGDFDLTAFKIKYGVEPNFSLKGGLKPGLIGPLRIFFPSRNCIAADLRDRLALFVPKPEKFMITIADFATHFLPVKSTEAADFKPSILIEHSTYEAALHDSIAILRLVHERKITGTLSNISAESCEALWGCLQNGDFYPQGLECSFPIDVKMGAMGIKPFAWLMLLSAGNLIKCSDKKFILTSAGKDALSSYSQNEPLLRELWECWIHFASFNELHRVDIIKGQRSTPRPLLPATPSRIALTNALAELPVGQWVLLEEFFRYLIANGYDFEVSRDVWSLYLEGNPDSISLGHSHIEWNHLNGRFARAFLLEYAATLGIIDVILCSPWHTEEEFSEICGLNHLSCMSRYDGLKYLKLTAFGSSILNASFATPSNERKCCASRII